MYFLAFPVPNQVAASRRNAPFSLACGGVTKTSLGVITPVTLHQSQAQRLIKVLGHVQSWVDVAEYITAHDTCFLDVYRLSRGVVDLMSIRLVMTVQTNSKTHFLMHLIQAG